MHNVPPSIAAKIGKNLHLRRDHPISIIKEQIYRALPEFTTFDGFHPVVPVEDNFDLLLIPKDHPSRRPSDTYYWDEHHVLRTHTSAHQVGLLRGGQRKFLVTGDVYRKDAIDATHYPVFHQMEGVCITASKEEAAKSLLDTIGVILHALFPGCQNRWRDDYFPFTDPSYEVSVFDQENRDGKELEVLGCGVIHPDVLKNAGLEGMHGWAFGLGLERLAMKLFGISDIRLFWSEDKRFLSQFKAGVVSKFEPFSKHPACYKDIAMWVPPEWQENDLLDVIRDVAGDLVESVEETDTFKKGDRTSKCYRIMYRSMERTLSNEEVNDIQSKLRGAIQDRLKVEIR